MRGAAAWLAANGLDVGGLADGDAPLAERHGAGCSGARAALMRLLQPPGAPGAPGAPGHPGAPRGGGGASRCVLLQPPYLVLVRHWTSVTQSIGLAEEDALPLELRPRRQAWRTALRQSAGHAPALRPPPSHVRLRMLWLGDSIVSDLDRTGTLSWMHACNWHDCVNPPIDPGIIEISGAPHAADQRAPTWQTSARLHGRPTSARHTA